jgi:hypothetical protein
MQRLAAITALAAIIALTSPSAGVARVEGPFDLLQKRIEQAIKNLEKTTRQVGRERPKAKPKKVLPAPVTPTVSEAAQAKEEQNPANDALVPLPRWRPGDEKLASGTANTDRFAAANPGPAGFPGEGADLPDDRSAQSLAFDEPPLPAMDPRFKVAGIGGFVEPSAIPGPVGKPAKVPLPEPSPVKPPIKLASLPPADEGVGMNRLAVLGVGAKAMPPINESACGIPDPVAVASLDDGDVPLSGKATVNHRIAETLAVWVRNEVEPAARQILNGNLTGLRIAASYDCRTRDGIKDAKLSEHALGNAIDISAFKIDKRWIEVGGSHPPDEQNFLDKIRTAACGPFTTVLGPGSDSYHSNHFHLDLASRNRKGKSRGLYCH